MFEEIISALQGMNIGYEEMSDQGMLSVEVGEMDKMQLIELLNMVYSMNMTVTALNESSMTISGGEVMPQEDVIEPIEEEETEADAAQMAALDEAMSGM
jgi:hypothetical protein